MSSMDITRVGVIGAGTIGRGVAQAFSQAAYQVVLIDIAPAQLTSALDQIEQDLRLQRLFRADAHPEAPADVLARITTGTDLERLAAVDFVVENVTESWAIKREVYERIDGICKPDVIFAVNTSAVPITRVAAATGRRENILGLHFMNPVPLMDMVEVVRGHFTSDATMNTALEVLATLRKTGVVVQDMPGFITNRVLMLTINEAIFSIQDQVASAVDIDRIFKGCFGHKMGPLETADLIGLDTILNSITVLYESFRDSKYRPAPLLQKMVDAGLLGRKTGRGFYTY
jgi:3-hydroxybutyryl-CoA dehydrogenase